MNKVLRMSVLVALILSLVSFGLAGAQSEVAGLDAAVTYTSGFQVQNLESANAMCVPGILQPGWHACGHASPEIHNCGQFVKDLLPHQ